MKFRIVLVPVFLSFSVSAQINQIADHLPEPFQPDDVVTDNYSHFLPDGESAGQAEYLHMIPGITHTEWSSVISHIAEYGLFLSPLELQQTDGIDSSRIAYLLPYLQQLGFFTTAASSEVKQMLRIGTGLRQRDIAGNRQFRGSPYRWDFTWHKALKPRWKLFLKAEKDPGEKYTDLYGSFSLHYSGRGRIQSFIAGDFRAQSGQGLLYSTGSGFAGNASPVQTVRAVSGFKPWNSWTETAALHGIAIVTTIHSHLTLESFVAFRRPDALLTADSQGSMYTSVRQSGLYRNQSELDARNAFVQILSAERLMYKKERFELGLAGIFRQNTGSVFRGSTDLHRRYSAQRPQGLRAGIDWKKSMKNMMSFGEVVYGGKNRNALLTGLIVSAGKYTDISLLFRQYSRGYDDELSNAWGRFSRNANETGLFCGLGHRLPNKLQINYTLDVCRSAWLRYTADFPAVYTTQLAEFSRKQKNGQSWLLRYRRKTEELSKSLNSPMRATLNRVTGNYRLQSSFTSGQTEFRTRLEYVYCRENPGIYSQGFLMFHDLQVKLSTGIRMRVRLYLHHCESPGSSVYGFENDIPGRFSLQAYSGKGAGAYAMFRFRIRKDLDIWLRFANRKSDALQGNNGEFQVSMQWNTGKKQN